MSFSGLKCTSFDVLLRKKMSRGNTPGLPFRGKGREGRGFRNVAPPQPKNPCDATDLTSQSFLQKQSFYRLRSEMFAQLRVFTVRDS